MKPTSQEKPAEGNEQAIIQSWQDRASAYLQFTEQWSLFPQLANRLVDLIPVPFSGTALDLAAGAGLVSACLLQRHPHTRVYLVEPAEAMLALALPQLGDRVIGHTQLRAEDIGTVSIQADVILCSVAMHLIDEGQVFPGIAQCLKPDGLFIFNLWWHPGSRPPYQSWAAVAGVLEQSLTEFAEQADSDEPPVLLTLRSHASEICAECSGRPAGGAKNCLRPRPIQTRTTRFFIEFLPCLPTSETAFAAAAHASCNTPVPEPPRR